MAVTKYKDKQKIKHFSFLLDVCSRLFSSREENLPKIISHRAYNIRTPKTTLKIRRFEPTPNNSELAALVAFCFIFVFLSNRVRTKTAYLILPYF